MDIDFALVKVQCVVFPPVIETAQIPIRLAILEEGCDFA